MFFVKHTFELTHWGRDKWRHFADDIFKCIFLNENVWIPIKMSLKFVPKGPINNISAMVQIMAWRRSGDKPLFEPMMVSLPTHICVARPQWVKPCPLYLYSIEPFSTRSRHVSYAIVLVKIIRIHRNTSYSTISILNDCVVLVKNDCLSVIHISSYTLVAALHISSFHETTHVYSIAMIEIRENSSILDPVRSAMPAPGYIFRHIRVTQRQFNIYEDVYL